MGERKKSDSMQIIRQEERMNNQEELEYTETTRENEQEEDEELLFLHYALLPSLFVLFPSFYREIRAVKEIQIHNVGSKLTTPTICEEEKSKKRPSKQKLERSREKK